MKKALLIGLLVFLPQIALAGSQTFTSSGTFTVPAYGTLTVEVWGGGAGGGIVGNAINGQPAAGNNGQQSSFNGTVIGGGGVAPVSSSYSGGAGGAASGGDVKTAGGAGGVGHQNDLCPVPVSGAGGTAPNGGAGGAGVTGITPPISGSLPGGGGGGNYVATYRSQQQTWYCASAAGGGAGAYSKKTYSAGTFSQGSPVTVVVGSGGAGKPYGQNVSSSGAAGRVTITWTDPPPSCTVVYGDHSATISNPGTCTFTVPDLFNTLTAAVNGGGGGGGGGGTTPFTSGPNGQPGQPGTQSSFESVVAYEGGGGGGGHTSGSNFYQGAAGTSGAGDTPGGGAAGGRGGNGYYTNLFGLGANYGGGGTGGAGGLSTRTFASDALGSSVQVVIGSGGAGGAAGYGACCGSASPGSPGSSGSVTITWTDPVNSPPTTPVISGPTSGFTKTLYTYTFTATDPDSDTLRYGIDWNDNGTIDEYVPALGYVSSGITGSTIHSWNSSNTQTFKVLAQDSKGATSGWASYSVNMSPNAPTVLLTATPSSINQGQSSTLTWSSSNATSCTGTNFSTGGATQNTSPGVSVSPTQTTTYTVTCEGQGNQEASDSKTVTVAVCTPTYSCTNSTTRHSSCPLPSGTDTPCASGQVCTGTSCQDTYSCLDAHTIRNDHTGATTNCPAPLICSSGSPTCVTAPAIQVLGALEANPALVLEGDTTFLFWNIENADEPTCSVRGSDGTVVSEGAASSGENGVETATIEFQTVFTLTCTGEDGEPYTGTATVNVVPLWLEF